MTEFQKPVQNGRQDKGNEIWRLNFGIFVLVNSQMFQYFSVFDFKRCSCELKFIVPIFIYNLSILRLVSTSVLP